MEVIFPIRLYIRYELDPSFVFEIDFFFYYFHCYINIVW